MYVSRAVRAHVHPRNLLAAMSVWKPRILGCAWGVPGHVGAPVCAGLCCVCWCAGCVCWVVCRLENRSSPARGVHTPSCCPLTFPPAALPSRSLAMSALQALSCLAAKAEERLTPLAPDLFWGVSVPDLVLDVLPSGATQSPWSEPVTKAPLADGKPLGRTWWVLGVWDPVAGGGSSWEGVPQAGWWCALPGMGG